MLKTLPDQEAVDLLGRIRAGVEPRDLVEQVQHGSMLVQLASASASASTSGSQASQESTKDWFALSRQST